MYKEFYGLQEKPFEIVPNPDYLYKSTKHENALTYLEYGLSENVGFILLTGEIGSGKTTLIQYMLNKVENGTDVAVVFNTNVSAAELLNMILNEFEVERPVNDKAGALEAINAYLIQKYAEKRQVLLIIDEAQNLSAEALEEVRMLSNLQTEDQALLQIMLVGQPELETKLRSPGLVQFSQRIAVNFHLEGLSRNETENYINFRTQKAGGSRNLFSDKAIDLIYRVSNGIPRSINLLCQAALVYGFADEAETIGTEIIEQVQADKIGVGLDADTSAALTVEPYGDIENRLHALENEVRSLKEMMETQVVKTTQLAEGFKDDLIDQLRSLLEKERSRNENLVIKHERLKAQRLKAKKAK